MQQFWRDTGRTRASLRYIPWGVVAAEALVGDRPVENQDGPAAAAALATWRERADTLFWLLNRHGSALWAAGQLAEATQRLESCLDVARHAGLRRDEGVVLSSLGKVAAARDRLEEAEGYFQQSLAICREVQDRQGEGVDLAQLGLIAEERQQWDEAESYYRQ
jgi:tetratricopeptide (TPR) repeat protein